MFGEKQIGIISGLDEVQAQEFAQLRRQTVHKPVYFEYDCLAPGAVEALEKVQQAGVDLVVMTMRRVRELDYAFNRHDLGRFFPKNRCYCLSNDYVKTRDIDDLPLLMERALAELPWLRCNLDGRRYRSRYYYCQKSRRGVNGSAVWDPRSSSTRTLQTGLDC